MVCDKPGAGVVQRAAGHGARHSYSPRKSMPRRPTTSARSCGGSTKPAWSWSAWRATCASSATCCWGAYGGRIINIHPSLLPAFRGAHAIEQALEYGVKVFGVTIHYVDATLDGGKIVSQRAFRYDGDDIAELEARIHAVEYPLYIETINKLLKEQ